MFCIELLGAISAGESGRCASASAPPIPSLNRECVSGALSEAVSELGICHSRRCRQASRLLSPRSESARRVASLDARNDRFLSSRDAMVGSLVRCKMVPLQSVSGLSRPTMQLYLGLGSNEGNRAANLRAGIERLRAHGYSISAISPVVESPALLPDDAPADWNRPFLNLVLKGSIDPGDTSPEEWRSLIKCIEDELGRIRTSRWAPRPLDVDILLWGEQKIRTDTLTIPHPDTLDRNFVLTPLVHVEPNLRIPGFEEKTAFEWSLSRQPIPLWMGIVNLTPDSFSDGGRFSDTAAVLAEIEGMLEQGVQIIDVGAESTRPGAETLDWEEEWARLAQPLQAITARLADEPLAPKISVDTRNWRVAERALAVGASMINDVSGLTDPEMCAVARDSDAEWVVMHHLTLPASREVRLPQDRPPLEEVLSWLEIQLARIAGYGIDTQRLLVDPGIGFNKDALQSLKILRDVPALRAAGLRVLVGHSRKSFMEFPPTEPRAKRDIETIGASLKLCELGVDVLRVHNVTDHIRAYRAWSHIQGFPRTSNVPA